VRVFHATGRIYRLVALGIGSLPYSLIEFEGRLKGYILKLAVIQN
jgi:hypothetical protein